MHIDLPAIEAFLAVAESGSTHAAARSLGLSQASISRRISRLEELLGSALFLRSRHALVLSSAGSALLPQARQHVSGLRRAMQEVRMVDHSGGSSVTIACLATLALYVMPQIVAELSQTRPKLRLRILDMMPPQIEEAVKDGTAEFALSMIGVGAVDLTHEVIVDQPLVLVVAEDHPLAGRGSVSWSDLSGVRLIGTGPGSAHFQLLESVRPQIRQSWEEFHQVQRITTALAMVAAGNGGALLPLNLAMNQPFGVRTVAVTDPVITRRIGILRRAAVPLSDHADYLRRRIIQRLRQDRSLGKPQEEISSG